MTDKVKVTLCQVFNSQQLLQQIATVSTDVKTAFAIRRIARAIDQVLQDIHEQRLSLYKQYGEEVADKPGDYKIKSENVDTANGKLKELWETEIELDINPLNYHRLSDFKLSAADLVTIEFMIKDSD